MRKIFYSSLYLIIAAICLIPAQGVLAQNSSLGDLGLSNTAHQVGLKGSPEPTQGIRIGSVVGNALEVVLGVLGLFFFVLIFYSGIRWLTAEGNEEIVNQAKDTLVQAVWGFAVIATAYIFTSYIVNKISIASGLTT